MIKVPFLEFKNRKIFLKNEYISTENKDLNEKIYKYRKIYFLDWDGINKNKPNFCTYQRLSSSVEIWADAGPRYIGDVVDLIMSGINKIVIRTELWREVDFQSIKEYTEIEIYEIFELKKDHSKSKILSTNQLNGYILFGRGETIQNLQSTHLINKIAKEGKLYAYINNVNNVSFWKKNNAHGLIIDIDKMEGIKNI